MMQFQLFSKFIFTLEVLFFLAKSKLEIEGLAIFNYNYCDSEYTGDTIFFLMDIISTKHMVDISFSKFAGLKRNSIKSEIAVLES